MKTIAYQDIIDISRFGAPINPYLVRNKIVFVTGVFDLFHYGHVAFLKYAKLFGDVLWVGVHTDEAVQTYKGITPIMTLSERCAMLEDSRLVDLVIKIPTMAEFEECFYYYIDYHVQGDDNDDYTIAKKQKKFMLVPYTDEISTKMVKERIIGRYNKGRRE